MDLEERALCTWQLFLFHVIKSLKELQFHMGFFKKEIIDHPDQNRDASKKYERGDDRKASFLLARLLMGMGCGNLMDRYWVHRQLGIWGYCPRNCLCRFPLSACMLACFWLSLFSLDSGGKMEVH